MRLAVIVGVIALSTPPGFTQSGAAPKFEIADIRPSGPAMNPYTLASGGVLRGGRYDLRKANMLDLIRIACNLPADSIFGGPDWLEFDRFDIAAKAPVQTPPETARRMLQSLLAERFHLVVHNDMRPRPAWVLQTDPSRTNRLTESSGSGDSACLYLQQPSRSPFRVVSCRNKTMAAFAAELETIGRDYLKAPVTDATGLEGSFDFELRFTPRSQQLPADAERVTIFDAVAKQLGLSLTLREAPAPVLVVDRVDKPTPNSPDVAQKLPPRPLAFEVADLKLDRSGAPRYLSATRGGLKGIHLQLLEMLCFAWDMDTDHGAARFIGLPKGVESVYFDVNAATEGHTNGPPPDLLNGLDDDLRGMMRTLLTERFRIQWHYEDRPMEAYSLVAARPKLNKADPANRATCREARTVSNDPRDANPLLSELISCRNATLAQFASTLQRTDSYQFVYPVEDATGIAGTWDFNLSFTPRRLFERNSGASEPNGAVSLAEALNKDLGLRLEKRKRLLPAIVVEHMELTPTEN